MFRAIFLVLAVAFTLVGPLVYAGPQLTTDLAVGKQWTIAEDLKIKEFKCTRWYFLVSTCDVDYVNRQDPGRVGGTLSYFVFGSWAGEHTLLLRSMKDPRQVGTTIGLDHLQQRLVSFGVFLVLALAFLVAVIRFVVLALRSDEPIAPSVSFAQPVPPVGTRSFGQRASGSVG